MDNFAIWTQKPLPNSRQPFCSPLLLRHEREILSLNTKHAPENITWYDHWQGINFQAKNLEVTTLSVFFPPCRTAPVRGQTSFCLLSCRFGMVLQGIHVKIQPSNLQHSKIALVALECSIWSSAWGLTWNHTVTSRLPLIVLPFLLDFTYVADTRGPVLTAAANESGRSDLPSCSLVCWLFLPLLFLIPSWKWKFSSIVLHLVEHKLHDVYEC